MKHTEERTQSDRIWDSIEMKLEYGYFADYPPVSITCYNHGELTFIAESGTGGRPIKDPVYDPMHSISKKSLTKLDGLIDEIAAIESLEGSMVMDGPSFECYVHLSNGKVTGFHYVSMFLSEKFEELESRLRKILREEFFLRKHKKSF